MKYNLLLRIGKVITIIITIIKMNITSKYNYSLVIIYELYYWTKKILCMTIV